MGRTLSTLFAISLNTFREAVRNKVLYSLLFFAVVVIIGALAFGALSVAEEVRLTTNLGLAGMSLFSVIIAVFVGVNLVYKELDRKTVYSIIPKPIHRYQFVVGKFFGMMITIVVQMAVMTTVLLGVLAVQDAPLGGAVPKMIVLILLEVMVITAVAVLFSSFSTPLLSGLLTAGVFVVGRSVPDIQRAAGKMRNRSLGTLLEAVTRVVPDLRFFYVTGAETAFGHVSVHAAFPDWGYVATAGGYALLYVTLVLMLAALLFSRRDFV